MERNKAEIIERAKSYIDNKDEDECIIDESTAESVIDSFKENVCRLKPRQERFYKIYNYFCDNVVKELLEESYFETLNEIKNGY